MKKVLFRSSVTGYNKKDVNDYIASADARHAEELARAERRVAALESELESVKNVYEMKISGLEASNRQAVIDSEKKLNESKASSLRALTNAQSETAVARQKSEELRKRLADAEARISRQNDEVKKLRESCASAGAALPNAEELAELRRRAAAYDELEKKRLTLPQAGIEAEAENVIQSARTEAANIRREAQRDNAEAIEETKRQVSGELNEIYSMIHRATSESIEEILSCMRAAEEEVGKLGNQLNDKNRTAMARVESMRSELEEIIEKKFDEAKTRVAEAEKVEKAEDVTAQSKQDDKDEKPATARPGAMAERSESRRSDRQDRQDRHDRSSVSHRAAGSGIFKFGRRK